MISSIRRARGLEAKAKATKAPTWAADFAALREEFGRIERLLSLSRDVIRNEMAVEYLAIIEAQKAVIADLRLNLSLARFHAGIPDEAHVNGSRPAQRIDER